MRHTALRSVCAFVVLAALSAANAIAAEPGPGVGATFPSELAAPDQLGKQQTLKSLMGEKGVAIFFVRSADWCPFCKGQLVDVNRHLARFKALGLNVVSVSVDQVAEIAAFAASQKVGYTMLADPEGAINLSLGIRDEQYPVGSAGFGVPRPTLYVLDRSGTIRLRYMEPTYDVGAVTAVNDPANMSEFDRVALERDEKFNTRISGYIGWEQAARKLIPTPRDAARFHLTGMVLAGGAMTTEAVDYLTWRTLRGPAANAMRDALIAFLTEELGTDSLDLAKTYMEDALRMTAHLVMSTPEYQLV